MSVLSFCLTWPGDISAQGAEVPRAAPITLHEDEVIECSSGESDRASRRGSAVSPGSSSGGEASIRHGQTMVAGVPVSCLRNASSGLEEVPRVGLPPSLLAHSSPAAVPSVVSLVGSVDAVTLDETPRVGFLPGLLNPPAAVPQAPSLDGPVVAARLEEAPRVGFSPSLLALNTSTALPQTPSPDVALRSQSACAPCVGLPCSGSGRPPSWFLSKCTNG